VSGSAADLARSSIPASPGGDEIRARDLDALCGVVPAADPHA
jgi:hypothetical protein